jgi:beta-galactosidase/beta-glucuronidase
MCSLSLSHLGLPASVPPPRDEDYLLHGYPRPQLRRKEWISLNGLWDFALDIEGQELALDQVAFTQQILVPFSPETLRSGIGATELFRGCWYRRAFDVPPLQIDERLILHFGAVDYEAFVHVDGILVGHHEGGFTPFFFDISDYVAGKSHVTLHVRAFDDPLDLAKPRGKQTWEREPQSIWYPRTTGIWQTVWLEKVPKAHIEQLRWTSSLERWDIGMEARLSGTRNRRFRLRVRLRVEDVVLADDTYVVVAEDMTRCIALSDPGIDDFRNALLWSPDTPTLIAAEVSLLDEENRVVDRVESYTALRSVCVQGDHFVLNGRPFPLRLVLDQGYWPDTGLTAPDDEALRRDVELAKEMGFNGVRKHQKIEDPRYLLWADRLGLMVWEEMPSAYRFTRRSVERLGAQWTEVIERDASHPCIVVWVPFNESWGVPNLPESRAQRDYVKAIYHLTKTLDPSRPVIGNDGWESSATDIIGIHDYDADPARIQRRYFAHESVPRLFQRERPGGRVLALEGPAPAEAPLMLTEFGGIALERAGTWGYSSSSTPADLARQYAELLDVVGALEVFAGFCYTQFADTYQEGNGLLYADRTPKFPLQEIRRATRKHAGERTNDLPLSVREAREP